MNLRLRLPSWLVAWIATPPCEVMAPDHAVDDLKDLRRHRGLSAIMAASRDNVLAFQKHTKSVSRAVTVSDGSRTFLPHRNAGEK